MPTKRQFDLVILTTILIGPVASLFKIWAARKLAVDNAGADAKLLAGAVSILS